MNKKLVNTLRGLSVDMVEEANSGHPGAPLGMAPIVSALWLRHANHDATCPTWKNRDRLVLSAGHASAILYSVLHFAGYDYTVDDLKAFRTWGSKTPGHPAYNPHLGVEITTGPLGQGIANAVGMAIAETMLAARFNRPGYPVVDHRTYALCGDGCLMEGISYEAVSLAGTLKLNKLVVIYDDNEITIEGSTDIAFKENVPLRFKAAGWHVIPVEDGNDEQQVLAALKEAETSDLPTLIVCPTTIGYGSKRAGMAKSHGEPFGKEITLDLKQNLNLSNIPFDIDKSVYDEVRPLNLQRQAKRQTWEQMFEEYRKAFPELVKEWDSFHKQPKLEDLLLDEELFQADSAFEASRNSSGKVLNLLAKKLPNLVGGSADLGPSNKTSLDGMGSYSSENRLGRNLHFGVREHAMAAICNGMAAHGGLQVYCGTFLVFSDYMKNAVRMSAMMKLPVTYVFTHDSIGVGQDGETHQPVEQLTALRSTPGLKVYRPADRLETACAWIDALTGKQATALILSRQNLNNEYPTNKNGTFKGAYLVKKNAQSQAVILASGSELELAMEAEKVLGDQGIHVNVVSVPCLETFLKQDKDYIQNVLPDNLRNRVSIEAGATMPWYRLVGLDGISIGIDHYGSSADAKQLFSEYGFTVERVVQAVKSLI